jgi:O-antigen/teichoic acid export membrane protein
MSTAHVVQERENIVREIQTALRHTAVYGIGSIVIKALGFFMLPFYTHYLTPGDYGLLEILDLSMSLFGMVLHMGIAPALLRAYTAAGTVEEKKRTVSTAFLFVSGTGLIVFFAGIGLVRPASHMLFGPQVSSIYLFLSFSSFVLSYLGTMPRAYLRALEASGRFTLLESGSLLAMLALNVYFIAVLRLGVMGILWSSLIVNGIQAVWLSGWMIRATGVGFSKARLRQMVAFGLPLIFSNVSLFALNFSDRFFLQRFGSLEAVGIYAVGYKLAFMLNYLLVQPFHAMWQTRMYLIHARPEHPKIFNQIFVLYSLVLIYAALALSVFSPEIVTVMTARNFRAGQAVVPLVALAYVFYGIGLYLQLGMFLAEKTKAIGAVGAAAAVLNLALNYFLIQEFGMHGAAWATVAGFLVIAGGSYWCSQRALPLALGVRRVALALGIGTILYIVSRTVLPSAAGPAVGVKFVYLLLFPVLVWRMRILSPSEMSTLLSARNKTAARFAVGAVKS